jgi:hypothetical protein
MYRSRARRPCAEAPQAKDADPLGLSAIVMGLVLAIGFGPLRRTWMIWSAEIIRANGRAEGEVMRLDFKEDTAVLYFRPVCLEINAGG